LHIIFICLGEIDVKKEFKGALLVAIAAFFWGIAATAAKFILNENVNPFRLVNMRLNLAFIYLFLIFLIFDRQKLKITKQDAKYLAILGIVGIVGVQSTYYFTVATLNVGMAIFLQYLAPAMIVLYSVVFLKERLSSTILIALGISLLGSVFIIFGRETGATSTLNILGFITGLVSAFFLSFYTIYGKTCTGRVNAWTVLLYAVGFGALTYWFVSPPWELWYGITLKEFGYASYLAVFATIIPFGLYFNGLRFLTPSSGSIIAMLEPVIATISAYLLLNERMTLVQLFGGLLITAAVILLNLYYVKKENSNKEQQSC
jgi:drug/metabolite transporter (DMT)-like permease